MVLNRRAAHLKKQDITALVILTMVIVFLFWKAPHSYAMEDESFFLSFSHRLTMGDSLLTDDWQVTQLIGFLLYIPVKLYMYLVGSTEGIILFFRYLFVVFQSTVAIVIYCRLRKHGIFAIFAAVIYCLHIPLTVIMALSYNSIGLACVTLIGLLMATAKENSKVTFFIVGLFIACAVLCNPVLIFVYLIYTSCMVAYEADKNKNPPPFNYPSKSFSFKSWLWITFGISTLATLFFVFLFSRTSLQELINNLPMLFTDPAYQFSSTESSRQNIFTTHESLSVLINFSPFLFSAYGILMAMIAFDKKRISHRNAYLVAVCLIYLIYMLQIVLSPVHKMNFWFWMFPLSLIGLTCFCVSENKDKNIFVHLWVLGVLYALCLDISSDFAPWSSTLGLAVSDIGSIILIGNVIRELKKPTVKELEQKSKITIDFKKKAVTTLLITTLLFQVGVEFYIDADIGRYGMEYLFDALWPSTEKLDTTIETGPLKGIITTANTVKLHDVIIRDLDFIIEDSQNDDSVGAVLVTAYYPWCYLYLNMPYAAHSVELFNIVDGYQLPKYYELHPDKVPKYIYIHKVANICQANLPEDMNREFSCEQPEILLPHFLEIYDSEVIKESEMGYILKIKN